MHPSSTAARPRAGRTRLLVAALGALSLGFAACESGAVVYSEGAPAASGSTPDDKACFDEFCPASGDLASVVPPGYCRCECASGGAMVFETAWPPSAAYSARAESQWQSLCPNAAHP